MTPTSQPTKPEAITVSGAARRLEVSPETVHRRCDKGEIPHIRNEFGHRIILQRDLELVAGQRGL